MCDKVEESERMKIRRLVQASMIFDEDHAQAIRDFGGNWLLGTCHYCDCKMVERMWEEPAPPDQPSTIGYWLGVGVKGE